MLRIYFVIAFYVQERWKMCFFLVSVCKPVSGKAHAGRGKYNNAPPAHKLPTLV